MYPVGTDHRGVPQALRFHSVRSCERSVSVAVSVEEVQGARRGELVFPRGFWPHTFVHVHLLAHFVRSHDSACTCTLVSGA